MPAPPGPQGQPDELIAAVERAIRARGEELIRHSAGPPTEWLSPTKAGLRYGDVCIAKSDTEEKHFVRASSYRAPRRERDKRPYRRWFGLDLLCFLQEGIRREVRIAQVLKGSRC